MLKRFIYTAFLTAALFSSAPAAFALEEGKAPEELSEEMSTMLEAARLQRKGTADKDKYTLMDAVELYRKVPVSDLKCEITATSSPQALSEAQVHFTPQFCEAVIAADFSPFDISELKDAYMRPAMALPVLNGRIGAAESVTFTTRARRACRLLLVSGPGHTLKVELSAGGEKVENMNYIVEDDGATTIVLWWQPSTSNKVDITVSNPGNSPADFMMAVN